jgi:hypothetical protein
VSQYLGDVVLSPGEETSAEYSLYFPRQLPPREFVLKVALIYAAGGAYQQKLFFNETVNVIEEPTLLDTQLIGLYLIGLAALAGLGEEHWARPAPVAACSHGCARAAY